MPLPDSFSQTRFEAHYAFPRDLTPTERRIISELQAGIALARSQRIQMAALPDSGTVFGPADAVAYYDDIIRDMLFEIARVEGTPADEIIDREAA